MEALPLMEKAALLGGNVKRAYIGAYGFERRSLGWCRMQRASLSPLSSAVVFRYVHPKGENKVHQLRALLKSLGTTSRIDVPFDYDSPQTIELKIQRMFTKLKVEEIILDISAMAKVLILATLSYLEQFNGTVRIIYTEAEDYCPERRQYDAVKRMMAATASFPSRGCEDVIRLRCLSSIRMQGQPVTLVAFTSFNEKLLSHMLGYMSPHRLLLINGTPPRSDYKWREEATQYIHRKYWQEYALDNPLGKRGFLERATCTLDYRETVECLETIYSKHGLLERLVCAATGSKMQTVGLYFGRVAHPDIQVEYPTPDSYYVKGMSTGVRQVHELKIPHFGDFVSQVRCDARDVPSTALVL